MKHLLLPIALVLGLAACSHPGGSGSSPVKPAVAVDPAAAVAAVRAAGEGVDSAVQVQPLRDPAIDGFLDRAEAAERARDYPAAVAAAEEALKLAPEAPDILQYLAELELARGDWTRAEELAMKSFNLGPKVGSLCARNWQTVVETRTALSDEGTVADARQRVKACRVPPPPRM
ncbi:MAG: tetratricopeptide repeat protein [Xanthomonadales bacterium]|nr:tetratricopeptide repeat protein [Xanthomonadales bacterium]